MNTRYKKSKWYRWEEIAAEHYYRQWYSLVERNYTIQWWELDLIFRKNGDLKFVEVKVVDHTDDLFDYVTQRKLWHVVHTINYYLLEHPTDVNYSFDIVFIKENSILEIYENASNS